MQTYKMQEPTGKERYNIKIPKITQKVPGQCIYDLGSVELENVSLEVVSAIWKLCTAANIPGTIELVKE